MPRVGECASLPRQLCMVEPLSVDMSHLRVWYSAVCSVPALLLQQPPTGKHYLPHTPKETDSNLAYEYTHGQRQQILFHDGRFFLDGMMAWPRRRSTLASMVRSGQQGNLGPMFQSNQLILFQTLESFLGGYGFNGTGVVGILPQIIGVAQPTQEPIDGTFGILR